MPPPEADLPPLADFLRWLIEMPTAFSDPATQVRAVVADLLDTLEGLPPEDAFLASFQGGENSRAERNRLLWVLATCHLLWHPALRTLPHPPGAVRRLLTEELTALATLIPADRLRTDEERREELVRQTLRLLARHLPGENASEAEDRLSQVDSVERQRLIREAADKERRAREIRERMAREAAQNAANRWSSE